MSNATTATRDESGRERSIAALRQITQVMRHPRCLNCHTPTESPKQGDDSRAHEQLVRRGVDGLGSASLRCFACHQAQNTAGGRVPGAQGWRLAPLHMAWQPTMTDKEMCEALKNKETNGNRNGARLLEHMTTDHLVQWAFLPGDRSPPPLTQAVFHQAVAVWVQSGMACP